MTRIVLTVDRSAEQELAERASRMTPRSQGVSLNPVERSIHFLRGVFSRSTMALPAFYLLHASGTKRESTCLIEGYPGVVFRHSVEFSSLATIALACRKAFDHGSKGLTGSNFAKTSDAALEEHAKYWAEWSARSVEDAHAALILLRSIFRDCSKTDANLFREATPLGRRVGLLKQYADRAAAHLTSDDYAVSALDCAHVVAALTIIGEIIRSFDGPESQPTYFDTLDTAALTAARTMFPMTPDLRLFQRMKVEEQARMCWHLGPDIGRQMLLEQLPYATGWY